MTPEEPFDDFDEFVKNPDLEVTLDTEH